MTSKKLLILLGVGILLIAVVAFAIVLFGTPSPKQSVNTNPPNPTFPIASTSSSTGSASSTAVITIQGQGNTVIQTKDFINNGVTIKDTENPGNYLLAGSLGYCLPDAPCTAGSNSEFNIMYDSKANAFTIALLREPLGTVRRDADTYLQSALGIPSNDICSLNYYIGTTYTVNESYAGDNLGFSMCPGAVALPQ